MRLSQPFTRISASFTDPNLVSAAALAPVLSPARAFGVVVGQRIRTPRRPPDWSTTRPRSDQARARLRTTSCIGQPRLGALRHPIEAHQPQHRLTETRRQGGGDRIGPGAPAHAETTPLS